MKAKTPFKIMFELPLKVASVMRGFEPGWFIAGGWAIDLFLEKETRKHDDIEIAIFRKDQSVLQNYLRDWNLQKVVSGKLVDWQGEFLELPVHEIHCFNAKDELKRLEVLLNETGGGEWLFRRDKRITKPLSEIHLATNSGVKFLCPEVVLLYKSKNPRAKDEQDFQAAARHLDTKAKRWLKNALSICYSTHHWLESL